MVIYAKIVRFKSEKLLELQSVRGFKEDFRET